MSIVGIDEVGRGPLAGPLVVGAAVFKNEVASADWIATLKDSKKLSAKKREQIAASANQHIHFALGWVSSIELDQVGITRALELAATRAMVKLASIYPSFSQIIIDGNLNFLKNTNFSSQVTTLVKADNDVKQVSAASIVAKVARDHYMVELAKKYPTYDFDKHMGYGTAAHLAALKAYGPCPEHRFSYAPVRLAAENHSYAPVRLAAENHSNTTTISQNTTTISTNHLPNTNKIRTSSAQGIITISQNTTAIGQAAESLVAHHLASIGHQIIAHNFRTRAYEIDLISVYKNSIYFTEVRCRATKSKPHITPLDTINNKKQQQITFAAESFIQSSNYSTLLLKSQVNPENITNFHLAIAEVYHVKGHFQLDRWLPI